MLKATLAAILLLVMIDMAVDHGAQTRRVASMLGGLGHWVSHMGEGSIFTR